MGIVNAELGAEELDDCDTWLEYLSRAKSANTYSDAIWWRASPPSQHHLGIASH
jgi:hypothetical protein